MRLRTFFIIDRLDIAPILFPRGKRTGRKGRSGGYRPPRPPKVAGVGFGEPQYYHAVDTAAAIGAWTVGIQLPLSDAHVLTIGFGGRRRPDVVLVEPCRSAAALERFEFPSRKIHPLRPNP